MLGGVSNCKKHWEQISIHDSRKFSQRGVHDAGDAAGAGAYHDRIEGAEKLEGLGHNSFHILFVRGVAGRISHFARTQPASRGYEWRFTASREQDSSAT